MVTRHLAADECDSAAEAGGSWLDVIARLGAAQVPLQFRLGPLSTISIGIGLLARGGKGATYRKSKLPDQPIEIWGYEASPFVKLAREVCLSLPSDLLLWHPCLHWPHHT